MPRPRPRSSLTRRVLVALAAAIPAAMAVLIIMATQTPFDGDPHSSESPKVLVAKNDWAPAAGRVEPTSSRRASSERPSKPPPPKILRRRPGGPLWTPETIQANARAARPPKAPPPPGDQMAARQSYLEAEPVRFEPALIAITEPLGVQVYVDGRLLGKTPLARPLRGGARQHSVVLRGPDLVEQRHEVRADQNGRFYVFARMHPVDARR